VPEVIPEVTLDKNIEAELPKPDPAELDRMAAEREQTKSLEEMSDKLAETLFGSEELEAISLQIREDATPEESPVALEATESAGSMAQPVPETPQAPVEQMPPVAPKPPAAAARTPQPTAAPEAPAAPAATDVPPPEKKGPQPEPIENQFNTSMTATLKSLNKRDMPPANPDDEDTGEKPSGLLGRLKNTFKS
jgi:hypothetical protein